MSVRVMVHSDVHFEFHRDRGYSFADSLDPSGVDVLVLAGDVGVSEGITSALRPLCERFSNARVLLVPGNHEYYRSTPDDVDEFLGEAEVTLRNLTVLRHGVVDVGGVRFAGTTLWFRDDSADPSYRPFLSDFDQIDAFVPWVHQENRRAEAFLCAVMRSATPPDVVVTHHMPSARCVVPEYRKSPLNRFFVAPVADEMPELPKFWVYGHTHSPADFQNRGCRFLCNAFGYPHEPKGKFRENLVIEVEPGKGR